MTKEQAMIEHRKIIKEYVRKSKAIIEEAEANGTWKMGLDSNNGLFKDLDRETKEKIKLLKEMVEE